MSEGQKRYHGRGALAHRASSRRVGYVILSLGVLALAALLARSQPPAPAAPGQKLLRWSHNVPGDSKPVTLYADDMTTWTEGDRRVVLLRGRVWVEQGVVQVRMREAVVWVDVASKRLTGIYRLDVYAEGNVSVEDGPNTQQAQTALIDLSTRGELRLKAYGSKVRQLALPREPLYLRARATRFPGAAPVVPAGGVQRTGFPLPPPVPTFPGVTAPPAQTVPPAFPAPTGPIQRTSFQQPAQDPPPPVVPAVPTSPVQQGPRPPLTWPPPPPPTNPGGTTDPPGPPPPVLPVAPANPAPNPAALPPPPPPAVRPTVPVQPANPPPAARPVEGPPRQISIVPRSSTAPTIQSQSFPLANGETAVVVTSGVIVTIRNPGDKVGLLDIEADRLVFWTRGDTEKLLNGLRSPQGRTSRQMEFYLAGNVELRQQLGKDNRLLRADEVYYDVRRNVAVALRADLELRQPGLPDPVHFRGDELYQLSPDRFRVVKAEVFSSRLPSDPGLKVVVAEATLEEKKVARTSIFGKQFVDRKTGQPIYETEQLFEAKNVLFKLGSVPVFYLPFLKGDANEPLGPLKNISFGENRVFGFQFNSTFKMYELLGMTPVPGTNWDLHVDYLSRRGPALGTNYDYTGKNLFDIPNTYTGVVRAYGIQDAATDILGGGRGENEPHPEWRGRLFWQQNLQDLPYGFTVQTQLAALSDKNFLEQYFPHEFQTEPNQETFLYVKQQQNNWAWTGLVEPRLRRWVTETESLPRFDGYLLGESFFDRLTYNAHASAGYFQLKTAEQPFPPLGLTMASPTDQNISTARFDLIQELSMPFTLGPVRVVPYAVADLTYYTQDLTGTDRGRLYGAGGVRASMPLTRLYPDACSDLFNVHGINHKIVLSGNYYVAESDTPYTRLPQLDRLNDDPTDQAIRDIRPMEPIFNPVHGQFLATSPLFDPQAYALRRLVDSRVDTLDTIEVFEADLRQRWQTKRGYPGQEHIVDWMTLDLSASVFPHSQRDNFGETFGFLEYDWTWNIGDRTALVSTGWFDPIDQGARVFTFGAFLNRPDRTNFFIGYREIEPIKSQALTASVTYVFSPKYAFTASSTFDFGTNQSLSNNFVLTRMGTDLQVSLGITYNAILNNFGVTFEIVPNLVPLSRRTPGASMVGQSLLGR